MLEIVAKGFQNAKAALTGRTTLTPENIQEAVRQIRVALLEADVDLGVVRTFLDRVQTRALGEVVTLDIKKNGKKLRSTPGDHFVLICHHELEKLMGPIEEKPIVYRRPYTTIMMVGLQGTGKTTTCGKLAKYLLRQGRKPLLVAADIYRPAAVHQLEILGERLQVPVYAKANVAPPQLCLEAQTVAKQRKCDVIILDTAGRLAIDDALMQELEQIASFTKPDNIFLVCDAMAGQDTVRTASEFNRRLNLSGFIMTKLDGDARGGAALSIKEITQKPIKFLGMGEDLDKLEDFRPEGLASRILGMGDMVGLMKDFEQVVDEKQAEAAAKKMLRGQFTLTDFLTQLRALKKMGSLKNLMDKMPMMGTGGAAPNIDDKSFVIMESIIQSMTPEERQSPSIIDAKREGRIAKGSGRKVQQVKDLLSRFDMMQKMMVNLKRNPNLLGSLPGMQQLAQLRKNNGRGMQDILGNLKPLLRGQKNLGPSLPAQGLGGFPNSADMDEAALLSHLPSDFNQSGPARSTINFKQKQKLKDKRKQARKARKQSRR